MQRHFKTLADSAYQAGDILLAPDIFFEPASCDLIPAAKDSIALIARFLQGHSSFRIEIGVHLDVQGDKKSAFLISDCRAKTILAELIDAFQISARRVSGKGYGFSQPVYSEQELRKRKCRHCEPLKNRRIEIKLLGT